MIRFFYLKFFVFVFLSILTTRVEALADLSMESRDGELTATPSLLTQVQYFYLVNDGGIDDQSSFRLRRIRPGLSGNFKPYNLSYKFVLEAGSSGTRSGARLLDAQLKWQASDRHRLLVGQFRLIFGAEYSISGSKQSFVDRSILAGISGLSRDIGVELYSKYFDKKLRHYLFVVNGDGTNTVAPDTSILLGTSLFYDLLGRHKAEMEDMDFSQSPNLTLGAGLAYDAGAANLNDNKLLRSFVHMIYRHAGVYSIAEAQLARNFETKKTDYSALGQLNYLFTKHWGSGLRFAAQFVDGQSALSASTESVYELSTVLNWYRIGHRLKLQTDYSLILNSAATKDRNDHRVRTQLQFAL